MIVRHAAQVAAGAVLLFALTACGSSEPTVMPDVVGLQLDVAKSDIDRAGFGGEVEIIGGGLFGVIDEGNWVVCEQDPAAGASIAAPRLVVERECVTDDEPTEEPAEPTEPDESAPDAEAFDTTVDELLDLLNSADMGGIQVGDRFRFTGELVRSDLWFTGQTGDFMVLFTAKGGADDLMVLVDESAASEWTDGTTLEAVVENVERTLDGETSDGWLLMVSATVIG